MEHLLPPNGSYDSPRVYITLPEEGELMDGELERDNEDEKSVDGELEGAELEGAVTEELMPLEAP